MAIEKKFQCIGECGQKFGIPEWECFPGQPHKVEVKKYYLADAPFMSKHDLEKDPDGMALRAARTHVHVIPDQTYKDDSGTMVRIAHPPLLFTKGCFETDNPMFQYYIERAKIDVGYDKWFEAYHTPKQKQNIKDGVLVSKERDLERKERELNDLLAQARQNVKSGKPASS
jgi:hypothetical protein